MAAEYSFIPIQTVEENESILFNEGDRACKKGFIEHRDGSGVLTLKGARNCNKSIYKVQFNGNITVAEGGTVGEISVAITENGETLGNAEVIVTPAAIGDYFNVSATTFIVIPCGCCKTVTVRNTSDGTAIDVQNVNLIVERVA